MNIDLKEYAEIICHFGTENQLNKLKEEMFELDTELIVRPHNEKRVFDEMADVLTLLLQFYATSPEMQKRCAYKLQRTKERIKSGYYD